MTAKIPTLNAYDEACRRIADKYSDDFADFLAADERVHELMMDIAAVFVTERVPVIDEDAQIDLASELILSVTVRPV